MPTPPCVLSIAGSDPSGGAGIQADLKVFSAFGVHGCAAITALTVQNTLGVQAVHVVPAEVVAQQVAAVLDDLDVAAVKIGMLGSAEVVDAVAGVVAERRPPHVVLDPVLASTSGASLLAGTGADALWRLIRLVDVVTPNLAEAARLAGVPEATAPDAMRAQAHLLLERGAHAVLLKGGHLDGDAADLWADGESERWFRAPRIASRNTHGTGCTLSSAVAAARTTSPDWPSAIERAKAYTTRAIAAGAELAIGHGTGPLWHRVEA